MAITYSSNVVVFLANGTYYPPANLSNCTVILRGAGGGGTSAGGGGGAALEVGPIYARDLPDPVPVIVPPGSAGATSLADNPVDAQFGDYARCPSGSGGGNFATRAPGGLSVMRGGRGGADGANSTGESVTSADVRLLAGGGGGGGRVTTVGRGGASGLVPGGAPGGGNGITPVFWQTNQSGSGGGGNGSGKGGAGGVPAGGGGGGSTSGGNGGTGCVTVIETLYEET